jgi:hypothetical protein
VDWQAVSSHVLCSAFSSWQAVPSRTINLSYDPITYVVMALISPRTVLHADSSVLNLSDTLRRHVPSTIVC